jgi:hypothetical protein
MALHRARRLGTSLFALGSLLLLVSTAGCPLGRGSKGFGEKCEHATDCAEAHCSPVGKICTKSCAADAECGAGRTCLKEGTSGHCDVAVAAPR